LNEQVRVRVSQPQYELPVAPALVRANQAGARYSFEQYRVMIDPTIINSWWQRHAAWQLQWFYEDIEAGKRPKLVLQAPPQHGKSSFPRNGTVLTPSTSSPSFK
jgi:hypothetical protein